MRYRSDPVGFLRRMQREVGSLFTLDLAGLDITLVADPELLKIYHAAPEDRLSARAAQDAIGFGEVLGPLNVHTGGDLHRTLLLAARRHGPDALPHRLWAQTTAALDALVPASQPSDALMLLRSIATRVVLGAFVDEGVLTALPTFVDDYARFQDRLEDAIARALVLPRWFAVPLLLRPVARMRAKLVTPLAAYLARSKTPAPYWHDLQAALAPDPGAQRQAEICIGLLFAAYKNPSIGAAQALLMLLSHPDALEDVRRELAARPAGPPDLRALPHLEAALKETLRLCALAIGSLRQVVGDPFVIGDFTLPVGRFVGASHILMSMRSDAWPDPERFDPSRFLRDAPPHAAVSHAWIPFSHGVHGCPGYRVALDFMACLVVAMLERYPALRGPHPLPPLDFQRATLAQRARQCPLALGSPALSRVCSYGGATRPRPPGAP